MTTVCVAADTIGYPEGGGHLWAYLNWALGLRAAGCDVVWLEQVAPDASAGRVRVLAEKLRQHLRPYELGDAVTIVTAMLSLALS